MVTTFIKSDIGMSFFGMSYKMGGIYEKVGQRGCSHLMEHLMCKTFDNMLPQLKRLGVDYNASTSDDRIIFYCSGLEEELVSVLPEWVNRIRSAEPLWTEEQFNQERNTVLQEYGDSFNSQMGGVYQNLLRKHYAYCGAIGLKEDIESFTYADSIAFSKKFLFPDHTAFVGSSTPLIIGDFPTFDQVVHESKFAIGGYALSLEIVPKEDKTIVGLLGINSLQTINPSHWSALNLVISCLTDGLESPLYQEIRDKRGLSYFSSGWLEILGTNCFPVFVASTTNEHTIELQEVYSDFFSGDVGRHISQDRFEDIKQDTLLTAKKSKILSWAGDGPKSLCSFTGFEGIDKLTYENVLSYTELFKLNKMHPFSY